MRNYSGYHSGYDAGHTDALAGEPKAALWGASELYSDGYLDGYADGLIDRLEASPPDAVFSVE